MQQTRRRNSLNQIREVRNLVRHFSSLLLLAKIAAALTAKRRSSYQKLLKVNNESNLRKVIEALLPAGMVIVILRFESESRRISIELNRVPVVNVFGLSF
jgi:5-formyltetrahydrofolate cyclo-ligase